MKGLSRRQFIAAAAAMGATVAWGKSQSRPGRSDWKERRDLFAEGVGSGDPAADSVILWTRYSAAGTQAEIPLTVEVAEDEGFERVIATARTRALAAADHTCRVLVGDLEPARVYYYRFTTPEGHGSRVGRTRTAAAADDPRPVKFAFVSCQSVQEGAQNAYRRMIYEDTRAPPGEQLAFVLHLGDFIYEVVPYPEDVPNGHRYDRRIRNVVRYPDGEKQGNWRIAASLADYRTLYRACLQDPDIQDARARFPFVPVWDNHEFSWMGWQSFQKTATVERPAQALKVAANQAWFEYQPARVRQYGGPSLDRFEVPPVKDAPIEKFDDNGLGLEPNNLAAIDSLIVYRSLRWGRHLDLVITDQHNYRSRDQGSHPETDKLVSKDFPSFVPEDIYRVLDAGRAWAPSPPGKFTWGEQEITNYRRNEAPQTILGATQKAWFLDTLRRADATWKVWGCSAGTLDTRADPQNLPEGLPRWPGKSYATFGFGDHSTAQFERAEIYDLVREAGITGFATVCGDRHSFWAGLAAKALPPQPFEPVGIAFITGSISAPGMVESLEHRFPKDHPLRPLWMADRPGKPRPDPAVNLLMHHGVRSCLEYQATGDLERALKLSNPDLSPHLSFIDMGGHGYATMRVSAEAAECEFVCIPRPLERTEGADGGPLRYRVSHRAALWKKGEKPTLVRKVIEGDPGLSL